MYLLNEYQKAFQKQLVTHHEVTNTESRPENKMRGATSEKRLKMRAPFSSQAVVRSKDDAGTLLNGSVELKRRVSTRQVK